MRLGIEVRKDEEVAEKLERLGGRIGNPTAAFEVAGRQLARANVQRIQSGRGMRRLAPATLQRKQRLGQPATPLTATGELVASLTPGGAGNVFRAYPTGLRYGTRDYVARFHQAGTGRMPRRRVLSFPRAARLTVVNTFRRFILKGIA